MSNEPIVSVPNIIEIKHVNSDDDDSSDDEFLIEQDESKLYASLIALFFSGNLTQTALKLVIKHTQLLTSIKLPKDFDQLMSKIETHELKYNEKWFGQICLEEVKLSNSKQLTVNSYSFKNALLKQPFKANC